MAEIVELARASKRPLYLTRHGKRVAAVMDPDELERLMDLAEEMEDVLAAQAARTEMAETGELPVPWDEVKADLGLS